MANRYLRWVLFLVFVFLSNMTPAAIPNKAEAQRHIGFFGIITQNQKGEETFEPTNIVPLVEGQSYGWIIKLSSGHTKVKLKEVFELPASPDTWGGGEASGEHEISEDRKVAITEREVDVERGYIQNFWSVAPGDPVGDYVIRVYVNGLLLETFTFRVVEK
jgi:hypothetical protein